MKKVLYGGGFDIFHWMHLKSIKLASEFGDHLTVMINSDRLLKEYKGKEPLFTEKERAEIIGSLKFVDEVVIKDTFSELEILKDKNIDILVVGDEWPDTKKEEKAYLESKGGKLEVIPYLYAERMPKVKERVAWMLEQKQKVLCEECGRKL